ncbi:SRPBCC family protein [Streptomyces gamaensis]|uniref:SRPBCC family protein n=1 Tax=Streptomyces gamaensis TaxID=1763542 RepID=A0ABW0YT39_9ACTN
MTSNTFENRPLFLTSADVRVSATPEDVYAVISDLPRCGEWSEECRGGEWISGEPATVGAVFQGENLRSPDVVSWAPVVRGTWHTRCEVVAAEPGRTFRWAMLDDAGRKQESVWAFDITADGDGSVLTHHFRMDAPTEGIVGITSEMDDAEKRRFLREWGEKISHDLVTTLDRIKAVVEKRV